MYCLKAHAFTHTSFPFPGLNVVRSHTEKDRQ
jgi:hypothetical protein